MLIELNNIVICLRNMLTIQTQQWTDQLKEICINPTALLNFKTILKDDMIEQNTKKMAASFLKTYFEQRYTDFDETFFIEFMMGILMDQKISYKYKIIMEDITINMLSWVEKGIDYFQFKENVNYIINCLENAFFCLQSASGKQFLASKKKNIKKKLNDDKHCLDLSKYYNLNFQNQQQFFNMGYSMIHFIECFSLVQNLEVDDLHRVVRISLNVSLTIFPMENTEINLRLQMIILHAWLQWLEMIEQHKQQQYIEYIEQQIIEEESLWDKIIEVYEYGSFNFTGLQNQQNLYVCSPDEIHKSFINKMKSYACQIHLRILKYQSAQTQKLKFINKTIGTPMFTRIIKTLSYFSIQKKMTELCCCHQFINSLLSLFIQITKQSPQVIDSNWGNIIHLVIFPLLTIDEKETLTFDSDPQQFCKLAEDCCDKQHLGQIKTEAARLLEILSDRSLNICQYIIQFCCVSLQAAVLKNQTKIQNTTSLLPLQSSFMTLAILSYNLSHFQQQKQIIKNILMSAQSFNLTQIEASRVFLFLAYNYTEIFDKPQEGKAWINFALGSAMHFTTRMTANDFLLNIVDEYFEEQFLIVLSLKLVNQIEIRQLWDILNKLLNNHLQKVSQQAMISLIEKILQRLSEEIQKYKSRQIKSTLNINNGLQLMRKILSNHKYISNKPKVLQQIFKVIPLYKTFKQLNLQDVILKIINEFMEREDKISELFQNMLPQLIDEFRQQGYRPTPFFWIWNQFAFKQQSIQKIKQIKNLLLEGLKILYQDFLVQKKKVKSNLPIAHCLIILQHILTLHGQKFSSHEVTQIYKLCQMILPEDINEPQRLNLASIIIGRILIVMLICHMLKKSQQKEKQDTNILKYLLLYHDQEGVFSGQNSDVIVKLLCKQLFQQSDPVSVTQIINIMVRILRPIVKQQSQHKSQKKNSKKSMKFKIKATQNYEVILKKIKSPFESNMNSEQQVKKTLTTMKQNNELLYKTIISYLPSQIKQKLRDLLSINVISNNSVGYIKNRRILKIGGIKSEQQMGQNIGQESRSRKRCGNFEFDDKQLYEQIDENELILQQQGNNKEQSVDESMIRKGKMKKNKIMKKLKRNQQSSSKNQKKDLHK